MRILQLIQLYQIWMQVCLTFWHNANRYETINIHVCHLPEHYLYGTSIRAMGALWLQVYQEKNRTPFFFLFFFYLLGFSSFLNNTQKHKINRNHTKQNKIKTLLNHYRLTLSDFMHCCGNLWRPICEAGSSRVPHSSGNCIHQLFKGLGSEY